MTDNTIITLFDTITLLTNHYHWIPARDWNSKYLDFFKSQRSQLTGQIFQPPHHIARNNRQSYLAGRWILVDIPLRQARGWAEIQILGKGISKGFLLFGLPDNYAIKDETIDAIIYLISATFVISMIDILNIGPMQFPILSDFFTRHFPDSPKTLHSFFTLEESSFHFEDPMQAPISQEINFTTIAATSWRKSAVAAQRLAQLRHIRTPSTRD